MMMMKFQIYLDKQFLTQTPQNIITVLRSFVIYRQFDANTFQTLHPKMLILGD